MNAAGPALAPPSDALETARQVAVLDARSVEDALRLGEAAFAGARGWVDPLNAAQLRKVALSLPEAEERETWGTATFFF